MKKMVYLNISALSMIFIATACSPGTTPVPVIPKSTETLTIGQRPPWQVAWDQNVAEAKKEGEVALYSIPGGNTRVEVTNAFRETFGMKVNFIVGTGPELTNKLITERNAGLYLADVILGGGTTLLTVMKPAGLLRPIEPEILLPQVKNPDSWRIGRIPFIDKDHLALGLIANYTKYILINTEMVKEGEITSYKDLLKPRWKGKMIFLDPTLQGSGSAWIAILGEVWGFEQTRAFLEELAKQEPVITRDKRLVVESVAKGKYAIAIAPDPTNVAEFLAVGASISLPTITEGGKFASAAGVLGLPQNPAHPAATTIFVNWLLSSEGQKAFIKGFGSPSARADVSTEGIDPLFIAKPGEKGITESEEHYLRTK